MLNDQELETLLADLESDRVERKSTLNDPDKIRQAICAFANDMPNHQAPGYIFIGVTDVGLPANFVITDDVLLRLGDMRTDMEPFPTLTVQKHTLNGQEVAVVEVLSSYNPPVRFHGRIWIRVGPRRAIASAEEERRLVEKRRAGNVSFDQHPLFGTTTNDLDLALFQREYLPSAVSPEVLLENHRSIEQQLASLHFLAKDDTPNVGALLILGKTPRNWLPGAYIQFLRIDGEQLTDPIRDQKEINGPLPDLLRELDALIDANIAIATDITSATTEIRRTDYPKVALQQLLRNAVLHRTYEGTASPVRWYWFTDRIEIVSPGGPYGQVNAQNFGKPGITDYRNPLIAEAMKVLGYVQKFGVGIPLARKALEQNGSAPLEFVIEATTILVTLRRKQ